MKKIKVKNCGTCPYNKIHHCEKILSKCEDYCILLKKIVKSSIIDEDCILEDLK